MTQSLLLLLLVFVGLTILGALLGLALGAAGRLGLGKRASRVITGVVFAVLALVTGFLGLTLFFSDGPPLTERLVVVAVAYPLFGFATGYFNPGAWLIAGWYNAIRQLNPKNASRLVQSPRRGGVRYRHLTRGQVMREHLEKSFEACIHTAVRWVMGLRAGEAGDEKEVTLARQQAERVEDLHWVRLDWLAGLHELEPTKRGISSDGSG